MEMMCPHCDLKGKAEEKLLGKKIRCPKCKKVFLVNEDVITGSSSAPAPSSLDTPQVEKTIELPGETITNDDLVLGDPTSENTEDLQEGKKVCSRCGFVLSDDFISEKDEEQLCSICA